MAIQIRRGNEADFQPSRLLPGEFAVSVDSKYIYMCFSSGQVKRLALTDDLTTAINALDGTLSGRITSLEDDGTTFRASLTALTTRMGDVETSITADSGRLQTVEQKLSADERTIADHGSRIAAMEPKVSTLEQTSGNYGGRLAAVEQTGTANTNSITSLQSGLSTTQQDVAGLRTLVGNHQSNLTLLNNKTASQTELENMIATNQELIDTAVAAAEAARDRAIDEADAAAESAEIASNAIANIESETAEGIAALNSKEDEIDDALDAKKTEILGYLNTTKAGYEEQFESALDSAQSEFETALNTAKSGALADIATAKTDAVDNVAATGQTYLDQMAQRYGSFISYADEKEDSLNDTWSQARAQIIAKQEQIQRIATSAETTSMQAMQKANTAQNEVAELSGYVSEVQDEMAANNSTMLNFVTNMSVDEDGVGHLLNIYGDVVGDPVYGIGGGSGGGGGGGGSTINAVFSARNTTGWSTKAVTLRGTVTLSGTWSSLEEDIPTGNGTLLAMYGSNVLVSKEIPQGDFTFTLDIEKVFGSTGVKEINWRVSDVYGQTKRFVSTINVVDLAIRSNFETVAPFSGPIQYTYTPYGNVEKTIYFRQDGTVIDTLVTRLSNRELSFTIPETSYGSHTFEVWAEADIGGEHVTSDVLYYEYASVNALGEDSIITSSYQGQPVKQHTTVTVPFRVYNPTILQVEASVYLNNTLITTIEADRSEQSVSFKMRTAGTNTIRIEAYRATPKTFTVTVTENEINVEAETEGQILYLSPEGRNNSEPAVTRDVWTNSGITAQISGFKWIRDGWQRDADGFEVFRLDGDSRLYIPLNLFASDLKQTGLTFEIEFATRSVIREDAEIISCYSGDIGFVITPVKAMFKGSETTINTYFKDNEHVRLSIVAERQSANRLMLFYVNGIACNPDQYASGERFSQTNPVGISIGSSDCALDIYAIRVYNHDLNRSQVVNNFVADTQDGELKIERYNRNDIYDDYGNITPDTIRGKYPYIIYDCEEMPSTKLEDGYYPGDVEFHDDTFPAFSFTAYGVQLNVQGTSSAPYYRKNIDMKFKASGFETSAGHVSKYKIRETSIGTNRMVVKTDMASSEGSYNVGGAMLYNDICPYKTPEMQENSKVRWGIEGRPILQFHRQPGSATCEFIGKGNLNLPKRAPDNLGYSGDDQSWEVERNNSANVKFQTVDFETIKHDAVNMRDYPEWYDDFEARFPDSDFRDTAVIGEAFNSIAKTNREAATGNLLDDPVTYRLPNSNITDMYPDDSSYSVVMDGVTRVVTFTRDTPAYRLATFRMEAPDYIELESAFFYYNFFVRMGLGIDSLAKNMFVGFHGSPVAVGRWDHITRKIVLEPYDLDTLFGNNNSGVFMFGYWLLDTDTVDAVITGSGGGSGQALVFNAQDSVLFQNLRDAFWPEINTQYSNLRTSKAFSYQRFVDAIIGYQTWSEAVYNEDGYVKYLEPLIYPVTVDESTGQLIRTKRYLTMMQGKKELQFKWWLSRRIRYIDSMLVVADAMATQISMRVFNSCTIRYKVGMRLFASMIFGGGTTPQVQRIDNINNWATFTYTSQAGVREMETYIPNGDMVTEIDGLPNAYGNEFDFSKATRLRRLAIGSRENGYSNANLRTFDVLNCYVLEYLDASNCPNLAISPDLSNSPRIKEIYLEGTAVTGCTIADGADIEVWHLPGTIRSFEGYHLHSLRDLQVADWSNCERFMVADLPESYTDPDTGVTTDVFVLDDVLEDLPDGALISVMELDLDADDYDEIDAMYDAFDRFGGVSKYQDTDGTWIYVESETAQVSGTVHVPSIRGDQTAALQARYPYITIDAEHSEATLYYHNDDGTLWDTETILDGGNGTKVNSLTRAQTAQYTFSPDGWALTQGGAKNADALANVTADRHVYPAFASTTRTYTVTFVRASADGGGTLYTQNSVPYGTTPSYGGSTPTTTKGSATDYPFKGWNPAISAVNGSNLVYTAVFDSPVEIAWKDNVTIQNVVDAVENGTIKTLLKKGNIVPLDLGTEGAVGLQLVAFDADTMANGSGTADASFIAYYAVNTSHRWNPVIAGNSGNYTVGTGTIGGYGQSELASFLENDIWPLLPQTLRDAGTEVAKGCPGYNSAGSSEMYTYNCKIWAPSYNELFNSLGGTNQPSYTAVFSDNNARKKSKVGASASWWWLRSANAKNNVHSVDSGGNGNNDYTTTSASVVFGLCLTTYEKAHMRNVTIQEVIAARNNGTLESLLSPGDIIPLDLGTEGAVNLQLMGYDLDTRADGNGKAKATFIAYHAVNTSHRWNPSRAGDSGNYTVGTGTIGGYEQSELAQFLENDIWPLLPQALKDAAVEVTKGCPGYNSAGSSETTNYNCKIWAPSYTEMFSSSSATNQPSYTAVFSSNARRKKSKVGASASWWWLRSARSGYYARNVNSSGDYNYNDVNYSGGVVFGLSI